MIQTYQRYTRTRGMYSPTYDLPVRYKISVWSLVLKYKSSKTKLFSPSRWKVIIHFRPCWIKNCMSTLNMESWDIGKIDRTAPLHSFLLKCLLLFLPTVFDYLFTSKSLLKWYIHSSCLFVYISVHVVTLIRPQFVSLVII